MEELKRKKMELLTILKDKKIFTKSKNGIDFFEIDKSSKEWEEIQKINNILKYDMKYIAYENLK